MLRILLAVCIANLSVTCLAAEFPAPRQVDERRAAQVGLRKIVGRHLRLYTDLPPSDAVDSLTAVFDAAVPRWADYFQIDAEQVRDWYMQGFLIQDRQKFAALGLLPKENPDFINGFSVGYELWLVEQSSDYYRRHLLLHEGTHGFMAIFLRNPGQLGDAGPGWYMEGMAELLGTHRWQEGQLLLHQMPARRQEVPMWGRIKSIRQAHQDKKPLDLPAILTLNKRRAFSTEEYAWCWALCEFLDSHPRWQEKFHQLFKNVREQGFNQRFRNLYRKEWPELLTEWRNFIATLDYGYDAERMAMQHQPAAPISDAVSTTIAADRGWQSTGWLLKAGQEYRITAKGRYQIANDGQPWPCEPAGVTLEYHDGHPLGRLLGAYRSTTGHRLSPPIALGLAATLKPDEEAILYLRVNDSPARLSDNRGTVSVRLSTQEAYKVQN